MSRTYRFRGLGAAAPSFIPVTLPPIHSVSLPAPPAPPSSLFDCPSGYFWNGGACVPNSGGFVPTFPVGIDPTTGIPFGPIPPNGPLPPGQGFQQVEAPGNPYPYVYIGPQPGSPSPGQTGLFPSMDSVYPNWNLSNPPGGSYQQSCSGIQSDGAGNLWAQCKDSGGRIRAASLNYSGCVTAPYNQNGVLGCGGPGGVQVMTPAFGSPSVLPGSFGFPSQFFPASSQLTQPALFPSSPAIPPRPVPPVPVQPGSGFSFSSLSKYLPWIVGGVAAVVVLPRILPHHR